MILDGSRRRKCRTVQLGARWWFSIPSSCFEDDPAKRWACCDRDKHPVGAADYTKWKIPRQRAIDLIACELQRQYSGYDVAFTTSRPQSGEYTMLVFGATPRDVCDSSSSGGVLAGSAHIDPGNRNPNQVGFVYNNLTPYRVATTAAHELAHMLAWITKPSRRPSCIATRRG